VAGHDLFCVLLGAELHVGVDDGAPDRWERRRNAIKEVEVREKEKKKGRKTNSDEKKKGKKTSGKKK
jgi:hypothetical protein